MMKRFTVDIFVRCRAFADGEALHHRMGAEKSRKAQKREGERGLPPATAIVSDDPTCSSHSGSYRR
jgi:hypothetical protein